MGHRAQQKFGPGKAVTDTLGKGMEIGGELHSIALKKRSVRQVQK